MADSAIGHQGSEMVSMTWPLSKNRLKRTITNRYFWMVAVMLAASTFLHYFKLQTLLPFLASLPLTRQAIGRIIFILPVAGAAFAFGKVGGLVTLVIAVLIMLPRVFLISPYPADALLETVGVAVVGCLVIWMIETQEKEKNLRQKAVIENAQLHQDIARQLRIEQRLNEVAEKLTSELELDRILPRVIQIAEELIGADGGFIALLDRESNLIGYRYLHNLPRELADVPVPRGRGLAGEVMTIGRPAVIGDYPTYAGAIPAFVKAGVTSIVGVPIVSGDQPFGTLSLVSLNEAKRFSDRDVAILAGIGRQAGIAIENARLYENMRFYLGQITKAQENERKRIARELHDDTAQALIDLSRRLDNLATSHEQLSETAIERVDEFQELIDNILRGVRRFSRDLRPSVLDDLGLLPALEWLTAKLMEEDGVKAELAVHGDRRRLPAEAELTLFRIVQEALNNVRRHSQASRVVTAVEFGEGRVRITVDDNGQGFELPGRTGDLATTGKLGLIGMHERAHLLDGTLTVHSEPGKGTTVTVDVPV
jgi:two-component system sensor histidine kinase DegS